MKRPRPPVPEVSDDATDSTPEDDAVQMEDAELGVDGTPELTDPPVEPTGRVEKPERSGKVDRSQARSGPPSVDEWQDFIGRIVLKTLLEGYVTLMLRDCDLSPREEAYIALSKEELKELAAPFAGFANKNKVLRKHGRSIVAAADSYEAFVALAIWLRRVNKVARNHRPELAEKRAAKKAAHAAQHQAKQEQAAPNVTSLQERLVSSNGTTGPNEGNGNGPRPAAVPDGFVNPGTG